MTKHKKYILTFTEERMHALLRCAGAITEDGIIANVEFDRNKRTLRILIYDNFYGDDIPEGGEAIEKFIGVSL